MNPLVRALTRLALARSDAALVKAGGGSPRVVRGRVLDPKFQFLEAQARKAPAPTAAPTALDARAQTDQLVYLFGGKAERGVVWTPLAIPAEGREIPARVYKPQSQDHRAPPIAYFHFGGGVVGNLETCHAFCTMLAKTARTSVVSVDYRLAPEYLWPAGLDDALHAYLWTAANSSTLGGPEGRAAIGGDSMGGNFAAIIAQEMKRRGGPKPALQLLIYPATDVAVEDSAMRDFADAFPLTAATMAFFMANYLPPDADKKGVRISPAYATDLADLPRALVYTAGFDPLCDQGERYAARLHEAGVNTMFHCFESLAHGFTAFTGAIPAADAACRRIADEVEAALRDV